VCASCSRSVCDPAVDTVAVQACRGRVALRQQLARASAKPRAGSLSSAGVMSLFGDYLSALDAHTEKVITAAHNQQQQQDDDGEEEEEEEIGYSGYAAALFRIVAAYVLSCCTFIVWWSWLQKEMSLPAWRSSLDGFAFQSKSIWNNPGGKGRGAVHPSVLVWSFSFWVTSVAVIDRQVMPRDALPRLCVLVGAPLRVAYYLAPCLAMLGGSLRWQEKGKEWALEGNGIEGAGIRSEPPVQSVTVDHGDL
jgi:hypothetical protein